MRFQGFIGPSYTLQSVNVDCQRSVNLFPEMNQLGTGKEHEVSALVPTPGLLLKLTLPQSPVRGLWRASNGVLYAVAGQKFYSISSAWAYTELGSLQTTTGPVSLADNGQHVVVVDGTYGYYLTLADNTWTQINDAAFYPSDLVTYQDSYFIFHRKGTGQFFISGQYAMTFDPLDFATKEGSPDNVVGVIAANQSLYVLGSQSLEAYYDSGDTFPFTRIQGAVINTGCAAPFTISLLQNQIYFIGGDASGSGVVYRMQQYQPVPISTPAIESVIRGIDPVTLASGARSFVYQQGGHAFYCLNLPGVNTTYCFDASTNLWHERSYLNLWSLERHRADCAAVAYGKNVVGDYESGEIYALDPGTYTDNGTSIARIRTAPHISEGLLNLFHHSFQLDMETGVGTDGAGQGVNPKVMVRWSDDGGHSWSNERLADIGAIGQGKTRVILRRLGRSRDRVYEVKITDPVKVVLIGAELGIEEGIS